MGVFAEVLWQHVELGRQWKSCLDPAGEIGAVIRVGHVHVGHARLPVDPEKSVDMDAATALQLVSIPTIDPRGFAFAVV